MSVAYVDIETTGLDPIRHPIWEIAIIVDDVEHVMQILLTNAEIANADPVALEINHFHERYDQGSALDRWDVALKVEALLQGRHIVGAVPSFDEERLRRLCNNEIRGGAMPEGRYPWHYHLIDVEAMAVGYLAGLGTAPPTALPWKSHALSEALGVVEPVEDEHTALGDARWAKRLYERMTMPRPLPLADPGRIWGVAPALIVKGQRYRMFVEPELRVVPAWLTIAEIGVDLVVHAQVRYAEEERPTHFLHLHLADVVAAVEQSLLVLVEAQS